MLHRTGKSSPIFCGVLSASEIFSVQDCAVIVTGRRVDCQWARSGVRVNAIAPGYFQTEGTGPIEPGTHFGDYIAKNAPLARPGRTEELDGILLFLASHASTCCTGQTIIIDGCWTAR
jgi:NAD(P)-dependent dehydrogenase (short-subunit alcohol dehydrogenase family)